jgi:hypothetical protein
MKKSKEGKEIINKVIHSINIGENDVGTRKAVINNLKQKQRGIRKAKEYHKKKVKKYLYGEKKDKFPATSERSVNIEKICTNKRGKGKRILTEKEADNLLKLSNKFTNKYKCGSHWHLTSKSI